MKKLLLFLLALSFSSYVFAGLTGFTKNITGDGKIEITYTLEADNEDETLPVFAIDFSAEIPGKKKPYIPKSVEGEGKTGIVIGPGTYKLVWNAKKDRKKNDPATINIKFDVKDVTDKAKYLCLNLKKYKMRYQTDPPETKKSKCKTKELWLRRIEPGTFNMGSPESELGRNTNETQKQVTLTRAFYLALFETTQKQFQTIVGYNASNFKGATKPVDSVSYEQLRGAALGSGWPKHRKVDETSSYTDKKGRTTDCPTFFYALRQKTGGSLIFDLPTEAQWEYACRAETTTAFNNGSDITDENKDPELDKLDCYKLNGGVKQSFDKAGNLKKEKEVGPAKAGSFLPNAWNLFNMHGNVSEWCLDWYGLPSGGIDPLGPDSDSSRVFKGGSWNCEAKFCRSAFRTSGVAYIGNNYTGFRIALVKSETAPDREEFEYELPEAGDNTLPVYTTKFYGRDKDGNEFLLTDYGKLEEDGAAVIVLGGGIHKCVWIPDTDHTNLIGQVEYGVTYEDVTDQAAYLVLNIPSNIMHASPSGPALSFDDCRTEELWFKRIEPGTFYMGSPVTEKFRYSSEQEHSVKLRKAYYIGVFETTQKQYENLTGQTPSKYPGDTRPVEQVSYDDLRGAIKGSAWPADRDVEKRSFFGKMRTRSGNLLDLPTEAQWEYACRAGKTTAWNDGTTIINKSSDSNLDRLGRYYYDQQDGLGGYGEHTAVGSYLPNSWGLYDAHGNVSEWCLDWYGEDYGTEAVKEPKGPASGTYRVFRGGSFGEEAALCRSASRLFYVPGSGFYYNGFRIYLGSRGKLTKQSFTYTLPSFSNNALPVFKVKFYGETDDGTEYLLSDIGTLEGEGFSGVAIGSGSKKITWIPDSDHEDLPGELEMRVEYEDITSEAKYVVLTMSNNWLRVSKDAPDLEYGSIGSGSPCRYEELWLKRIEPSTFNMGSPEGELGRDLDSDDETRHQVRLTKPYYIGIFEVTQGQYKQVAKSNPSKYTGGFRPVQNVSYDMIRGADKGANFPADNDVDPDSFLGKLRARSFCYFDLPTEAQWEFACRAGTTTALNNGTNLSDENEDENLNKLACYYYNYGTVEDSNGNRKYVGPTNVGNWLPNNWGLYDMHGNVSEWSLDWIADYNGDETDPKGPESGYYRVLRSFGWNHLANRCRSASRGCNDPFNSGMSVGFRLVIIPKE